MTQPLALVLYEKLMPGSQLVNRLQDLNYRVQTLSDPKQLVACAETEGPMLVLADLEWSQGDICKTITSLRQNRATGHIPIIAFTPQSDPEREDTARQAGATVVVNDAAVLSYLPQILEQALQLE